MITDRARHLQAAGAYRAAGDYLVIAAGAAAYALSVAFFTAPNGIAPGGVTGLATVLHTVLYVPIGATALVFNIPLFVWGAIESGTRFIFRTVFATALVSLFIDAFSLFVVSYQGDLIIASIFGGILGGSGMGLIFLRGGSTGGTDIIARNVNARYPHISVGSIVLLTDAVVITLSALVYGSLENALYAVITIFTSAKMIDAVVFGFSRDNGKLLIIVTADAPAAADAIITRADRGVTVLSAHGGYSKSPLGVILCAVRPHDVYRVKTTVTDVDSSAFIITTTATAISGNGFTN